MLLAKVHLVKAKVFPVVMYGCELDYKESWVLKKWCFWTVVLGKTLENPLDFKKIKPVHPKGNRSWIFIGRTDAEAETLILWPPDSKNWLTGKDPDAGKEWKQEEKGMTEDEMIGWHQWLDRHEFEQALGVGDEQGSLECCSTWGHKELNTTEWLNWTSCCWPLKQRCLSKLSSLIALFFSLHYFLHVCEFIYFQHLARLFQSRLKIFSSHPFSQLFWSISALGKS